MFKRNGTGENSANLPLSLCPSLLTHPHLIYFFRLLHQCPYFHPFPYAHSVSLSSHPPFPLPIAYPQNPAAYSARAL